MDNIRYALKDVRSGKWIALDSASGGYPYDVDSIWLAKLWHNPQDAISYTAVMSWADYDNPVFTLHPVVIQEGPVFDMPTGADLKATRR